MSEILRRARQPLGGDAEDPVVLAQRGQEAGLHPLELEPEHVERVGPLDRVLDPRQDGDAELVHVPRQQRRRAAHAHLGAQLGQSPDVAARHAAVQDVAADGDLEALDPAEAVAQGEDVEQALGRVLVLAVARVDDVATGSAGPGTAPRPDAPWRMTTMSIRIASRFRAVSTSVSPLETEEPAVATLTVSALSRFSANSKEIRVRVEASKNRLTIVLPRSAGTFLIGRSLTSLNGSAVSRMSRI